MSIRSHANFLCSLAKFYSLLPKDHHCSTLFPVPPFLYIQHASLRAPCIVAPLKKSSSDIQVSIIPACSANHSMHLPSWVKTHGTLMLLRKSAICSFGEANPVRLWIRSFSPQETVFWPWVLIRHGNQATVLILSAVIGFIPLHLRSKWA